MANMVVNSDNSRAVRCSQVTSCEIIPRVEGYELVVWLSTSPCKECVFETDDTLEGIQAKAQTLLAALEA